MSGAVMTSTLESAVTSGLSPDALAERAEDVPRWQYLLARAFCTAEQRATFYDLLASLIEQGSRIDDALTEIYWSDTDRDTRRWARSTYAVGIPEWLFQMRVDGVPFATAFGPWAPPAERMALHAFEDAGLSASTLRYLAVTTVETEKTRATIRNLVTRSVWGFGAFIGITAAMSLYVIPLLSKQFPRTASRAALDRLETVFSALATLTPFLIALAVLLPPLLVFALPNYTGRWRVRLDRWPVFATYRIWTGAQWLRAMAALIAAGVRIPQALALLSTHGTPYFNWQLAAISEHVSLGLAPAMREAGRDWPSPDTVTAMEILMRGKNPEEALRLYSDRWFRNSAERIARSVALPRKIGFGIGLAAALWFILTTNDMVSQIAVF